jgi:hypothetical protein
MGAPNTEKKSFAISWRAVTASLLKYHTHHSITTKSFSSSFIRSAGTYCGFAKGEIGETNL